jgi:hypothetical protein
VGAHGSDGRKFGRSSTESDARERVIVGDREAGVRAGELPTGGPVPGDRTNVAVGQGQDEDDQGEGESAGAMDKTRRHGQVHGDLYADGRGRLRTVHYTRRPLRSLILHSCLHSIVIQSNVLHF